MSLPMNIDATYVLWSRGRPVERRVAIMRSYNIATPRNDIKLSPQWMRDLPHSWP